MSTDDLSVQARRHRAASVVSISGTLDSRTYLLVRDAIVKAAVDTRDGLVVDVRGLRAPVRSAWSVLTSAAWLVRDWPRVPITVVSDPPDQRELRRSGVTRYVPAHTSLDSALDQVGRPDVSVQHRLHTYIPRAEAAVSTARILVSHEVSHWNPEYTRLALVMTTVLVSNVVAHTDSDPDLRIEVHDDDRLVLAVGDDSLQLPARMEDRRGGTRAASGLELLSSLAQRWGATPTGTGKTVWAAIGPDEVAQFASAA